MNAITRWFQVSWLALFTILACLFGWVFFISSALGADSTPDGMPLGPIIAAAIVTIGMGRAELREWGRNLVKFGASPGWYALVIVIPVAVIIAAVLVNYTLGAPLPTLSQLTVWHDLPKVFVTFLILVGIGEEAGWTAFASPRLLSRNTFIKAWLILSAIRVLWHLPLMLIGELPWSLGIAGNIAFQFLVLWVFRRSGGVWFLAAIWHAMLNTTGGKFFFQMVEGKDKARLAMLMTAGYVLVAIAVFLIDRRRLDPLSEINQQGQ